MVKKRYNLQYLKEFCEEHNITLLKSYDNERVSSRTFIDAKCITTDCLEPMVKKTFKGLDLYRNFGCVTCSKDIKVKKTKEVWFKNHGVEHPGQLETVRQKMKETNMKKYGVEYVSQLEEIKKKKNETSLKNFGTEHPSKLEVVQQKMRKTCLKNHGTEYPSKLEKVKQKMRETNLKNNGVPYPSQSNKVKQKKINTCLIKYGVEWVMQNALIAEKSLRLRFKRKEYLYPSGRIDLVQGYEPFALNNLINIELITEGHIITSRTKVPEVWYIDNNDKKHRYYVDIYIPSQNRCIEVKSVYTASLTPDILLLKKQAVINNGYQFEMWIYDSKGKRLI